MGYYKNKIMIASGPYNWPRPINSIYTGEVNKNLCKQTLLRYVFITTPISNTNIR